MFDKFKDECGVFGIFGHPEAANMTYLGLYALQHRGQESAGISASDGQQVRISREMGYVADIFDGATLAKLPGPMAIGHVRYSTAGESKLLNAQPILIDCAHGQIALCHNGNIVNARELRDELVQQGSIFQSNSDTEVILHLYARSKARSIDDAIVESVAQVQGAFSLVMLTRDRLIAVRDPHGFRPLALGRLGRRLRRLFGDVRDGSHRRHLRTRCRARRSADYLGRRRALDQTVSAGAARALHLRARLFRAARQLRLRPQRERGANRARARARAREVGRRRRRRAGARLGRLRGDGIRRAVGRAAADGADQEPLRRPDVHPAAGVDPALRRQGEAEPGAERPERQARDPGRRFARARDDEPEDREDGARRGRERGARSHQLSADDLAVLLRCRHAAQVRPDCGDAYARRDSRVPRGRQRRAT